MINFSDIGKEDISEEDLQKIKGRTFNSDLKNLISKITITNTQEKHEEENTCEVKSVNINEEENNTKVVANTNDDNETNENKGNSTLIALHEIFYKAINLLYAKKRDDNLHITKDEFSDIYFYNEKNGFYESTSKSNFTLAIPLDIELYRIIRRNVFFTISNDKNETNNFLNFAKFAHLDETLPSNSKLVLFPPIVLGKSLSKKTILKILDEDIKKEIAFKSVDKYTFLIEFSKLYNISYLISTKEKNFESLLFLKRIKSKITLSSPTSFTFITSMGKLLIFCFDEEKEIVLKEVYDYPNITCEEIKNFREVIFSCF